MIMSASTQMDNNSYLHPTIRSRSPSQSIPITKHIWATATMDWTMVAAKKKIHTFIISQLSST